MLYRAADERLPAKPDKTSIYHPGGCQCTVPPNIKEK